ncbi:MAG: hypothetical protein ACM3PF_06530 [Bacteroidota bacterium]
MRATSWTGIVASAIVVVTTLAGCGGGTKTLGPQFQPEVANSTDTFQFQATGLTGVTQTLTYTWRNTGTQSSVDQSCAITGGTATVTLSDSTGTQVYSRSLAQSGSFPSTAGLAGAWSIRVTLSQVQGTLNFRAQKM